MKYNFNLLSGGEMMFKNGCLIQCTELSIQRYANLFRYNYHIKYVSKQFFPMFLQDILVSSTA